MNVDTVAMHGEARAPAPEEPLASFAAGLLCPTAEASWVVEAQRLGVGLGLAALFGASVGLRAGGAAILTHAIGVPLGILAVAAVAVPAFVIVLALANAPIDVRALGRATSRAAAKAGLVLGGFAPAAALYVVTLEDAITVSILGFVSLLVAGTIALRSFSAELRTPLRAAEPGTQRAMAIALPAFLLFAATLAVRVWWLALPILTGAR